MKSLKILCIVLVLVGAKDLRAQTNGTTYSKFPLKVAFGNQVVGFPFENVFSTFNPHISAGTERVINKNQKHGLLLSTNLGFIRNTVIGNIISLDFDFGYRYTSAKGLYLEADLGMGLITHFHPGDIYQQNASDGTYSKVKNSGRSSSLIGLKLGIGYDFSKRSKYPIAVGLIHNPFIQTSYFDVASFPIMPQSTTKILITYKFKKS